MTDHDDIVTAERVIPAPPGRIFELLADPRRHHDIDGSGTVVKAKDGDPQRLALGSKFRMAMKVGVPYSMVNTVVEFEDDRVIAWQTFPPGSIPAKLFGGRIWRYELEPVDGGTRVRESWDYSGEQGLKFLLRRERDKTRANMEKTLARIEELTTG